MENKEKKGFCISYSHQSPTSVCSAGYTIPTEKGKYRAPVIDASKVK